MQLRVPHISDRPVISRLRVIITISFLVCIFIVTSFAILAEQELREPLKHWADSKATNLATLAISRAVEQVLNTGVTTDLVRPIEGTAEVTGLTYAWSDLLRIKLAVTDALVKVVENISAETIPVPLGELAGWNLFAASGPVLRVRIIPIGTVKTDMRFDFISQGINQVLHRIYFDIQVRMRVVAPFSGTEILVHEQIPVVTELIQGRVPNAVINWSGPIEELRSNAPVP